MRLKKSKVLVHPLDVRPGVGSMLSAGLVVACDLSLVRIRRAKACRRRGIVNTCD